MWNVCCFLKKTVNPPSLKVSVTAIPVAFFCSGSHTHLPCYIADLVGCLAGMFLFNAHHLATYYHHP